MSGRKLSNTELVIQTLFTGANVNLQGMTFYLNDDKQVVNQWAMDDVRPVSVELNDFIALCEGLNEFEVEAIRRLKSEHTTRKLTRSTV